MRIAFEVHGSQMPTIDGRSIRLGPGLVEGILTLRVAHRDEGDDLPTDVLAADYFVVDRNGQAWQATSTFTTKVLVAHMVDIASTGDGPSSIRDPASAFPGDPALKEVRFSSDDRFYRNLLISGTAWTFKFHYTCISFDVFAIENPESPLLSHFAVRVNAGSLFDQKGDDVGAFGFELEAHHLLRNNTAIYSDDYERYVDSTFPRPLPFERIASSGPPQQCVVVL